MSLKPADLTPGTRVTALSPDWMAGQVGVVIDLPPALLNGHDCCIRMDGPVFPGTNTDGALLCMYAHELAVTP